MAARRRSYAQRSAPSPGRSPLAGREQLHARLFDELTDAIIAVDANLKITAWNAAAARMYGWRAEEVLGRPIRSVIRSSLTPEEQEAARRTLEARGTHRMEVIHYARDGTPFTVESTKLVLREPGQRVAGYLLVNRDVGERRRAEDWQRAVFEGSREAVFISDSRSRFVMVNAAAERLTGYTRQELLGMRIPDLHEEADLVAYREHHEHIMAGQEQVTEAPVRRKDGTKVPVEFNNSRITCAGEHFMHTVARDLTERRTTAAELASHVRLKAALAQLGQRALAGPPIRGLLADAATAVSEVLSVEYCGVLQLLPDGEHLRLVAGAGWREGLVGTTTVEAGRSSLAGYTLLAGAPVIIPDLAAETRFTAPPYLREHGIKSAVTVIIAGRSAPYGVLGAFAQAARQFSSDDVNFLSAVATVLAQAIIRQQEEETLTQLVRTLISVQEDERRALARELHDETGQALTSLLVGLRSLESAASPKTAAAIIQRLRDVAAQTLEEVSRLAQGLRPSVLDDLGLEAALSRYVAEHAAIHGLAIESKIGLDGARLPAPVEVTLYRIAQEALTNIARHAAAKRVRLSLTHEGRLVRLTVQDDGRGFEPSEAPAPGGTTGRLGLYGIRERAALWGGTAELRSAPGRGTMLSVVIPVES